MMLKEPFMAGSAQVDAQSRRQSFIVAQNFQRTGTAGFQALRKGSSGAGFYGTYSLQQHTHQLQQSDNNQGMSNILSQNNNNPMQQQQSNYQSVLNNGSNFKPGENRN
ncbi:hypothetical protein FGO68_gene2085 [Halteria grandinella]|uniref:Uncharacterized protein n=1 Tax=Halteria grandinella TaxID=5974 RepID=A0A8J8SXJ2_HALGN|nr:hypothetical protein FGO68_gene2085 [Halteria grandinella]